MSSSRLLACCVCLPVLFYSVACGGKTQETHSPANEAATPPVTSGTEPPQPAATVRNGPIIVAFGDSLTAGVAGRSYPEQLQDLLDANGFEYRVENQGVSGDTTTDGLARIDNVIAAKPALVILEFGGNDGLRGIPVNATRRNLKTMIERLRAEKIPLVLLGITLPPNYGPDYVKPFTAMFPDLAKKYHLAALPFLLQNVYRDSSLMQPDGIHPNGAGNRVVAQDVYNLIVPLLKKRKPESK